MWQVDEWLAFLPRLAAGPGLAEAAAAVNNFLALRTYLVGHRLTLADIALWGQLTGAWTHSLQLAVSQQLASSKTCHLGAGRWSGSAP